MEANRQTAGTTLQFDKETGGREQNRPGGGDAKESRHRPPEASPSTTQAINSATRQQEGTVQQVKEKGPQPTKGTVESKQSATLEDEETFGYNLPPDPLQDTDIIQHWCKDTLQWMTLTPMTRDEAMEEVLAMQGKKRKTDEKGI